MKTMHPSLAMAALLILSVGCSRDRDHSTGPETVLVTPDSASVRLGKTVQFTNQGNSARPDWSVVGGPGRGAISSTGLYRAPFFLPTTSTITIQASSKSDTSRAQVVLLDVPPDPADCTGGGPIPIPGEFVYVQELPEALVKVAPNYPDSARQAGVEGTVVVQALVCTSGMIFDTRVVTSIPMLDGATVDAVRQWLFKPAQTFHQPVAVWVTIPIRFSLH